MAHNKTTLSTICNDFVCFIEDTTGNGDPHFLMTSHTSGEHLCFDAHGFNDEVWSLVNDPIKGMDNIYFHKKRACFIFTMCVFTWLQEICMELTYCLDSHVILDQTLLISREH